jgi:hypothetical protein
MRDGRFSAPYHEMSCEDRIKFDRWLKANVVVASIFSVALVAIAFAGARSSGPAEEAAAHRETTSQPQFPVHDARLWGLGAAKGP